MNCYKIKYCYKYITAVVVCLFCDFNVKFYTFLLFARNDTLYFNNTWESHHLFVLLGKNTLYYMYIVLIYVSFLETKVNNFCEKLKLTLLGGSTL